MSKLKFSFPKFRNSLKAWKEIDIHGKFFIGLIIALSTALLIIEIWQR